MTIVLDLGEQVLTGVFLKTQAEQVESGPLILVWCEACGLVQLAHSFDPRKMYGSGYGYRSGLNPTMVNHLHRKVHWLERNFPLDDGAVVVDIGSNDGTLLNAYHSVNIRRFGFDPVAAKYLSHYDASIEVVPDFFSTDSLQVFGARSVSMVTSMARVVSSQSRLEG